MLRYFTKRIFQQLNVSTHKIFNNLFKIRSCLSTFFSIAFSLLYGPYKNRFHTLIGFFEQLTSSNSFLQRIGEKRYFSLINMKTRAFLCTRTLTITTYFPSITGVPLIFFWRKCIREPVCFLIVAETLSGVLSLPEENAAILFELLVFFVEPMID